jgi:hypothetical protein
MYGKLVKPSTVTAVPTRHRDRPDAVATDDSPSSGDLLSLVHSLRGLSLAEVSFFAVPALSRSGRRASFTSTRHRSAHVEPPRHRSSAGR